MNKEESSLCSYCEKPIGKKYTFSYGFPGIPRVYGCDRWLCKMKRKINIKGLLGPLIKKLNKWADT